MNDPRFSRYETGPDLKIFAFDHRMQFEEMRGADVKKISTFKQLCLAAALKVQEGRPGYGVLCDQRIGHDALAQTGDSALWVGRPVEWPGSRPLTLEPEVGSDFSGLGKWPKTHIIKCLCFCHPDDDPKMWSAQGTLIKSLFEAGRKAQLEFLLEIIPSKVGSVDDDTTATIIQRFYDLGVSPDWWKLEPLENETAWQRTCDAITRNDPDTRGIVVLGLDASPEKLADGFALAARFDLVKGFAVGRTIFGDVARDWMVGGIDDATAVRAMATNFEKLCETWDKARALGKENAA